MLKNVELDTKMQKDKTNEVILSKKKKFNILLKKITLKKLLKS